MFRRMGQLVAATAMTLLVLWSLEYSGATRPLWERLSPVRRITPPPSRKEVLSVEIMADITQAEARLRDLKKQRDLAEQTTAAIAKSLTAHCKTHAIDGNRLVEAISEDDPEVCVMVRGLQKKADDIEQLDRAIRDQQNTLRVHRARRFALANGVPLLAKQETPGEALRREMSDDCSNPQHNSLRECLRRYAAER